jgi:S-adenosylmethionine:tRNA ribosyltransferase-isomerase
VVDRSDRSWKLVFSAPGRVRDALEEIGTIPLPPYIKRPVGEGDNESYQTVFAKRGGAIAAPTAGLHFTPVLLKYLEDKGVDCRFITLHVGPGTFLPVKSEHVKDHSMLPEYYEMNKETFEAVKDKKAKGKRIIAVGSTATRTLEASVMDGWEEPRLKGLTDLFIYPGYKFKVISGMITNFHLPRSTLLMLIAAFIGRDAAMTVYNEALKMRYRFYSYGDAMMII